MTLGGLLRRVFGDQDSGHSVEELARRLGMATPELLTVRPQYHTFAVAKRRGGSRRIDAPSPELKAVQRRILRRLLARLSCHPTAAGFERGRSIVINALPHVGKAVVVKLDIRDFFNATAAKRVERYFRGIGWNRDASRLLMQLCTHRAGLPQGAPTSPRLSNLVNVKLDARLAGLAARFGADYTRYADDMTFSLDRDDRKTIHELIGLAQHIVDEEGYKLHTGKKLRIARRGDRQLVTGLVVNVYPNLPRHTRRWLRAVEHHLDTGRRATITADQLAGWYALQDMIRQQSAGARFTA